MSRPARTLAAALALAMASATVAQPAFAQAETGRGEGEVRKIDREQAKITVKHGPITDLKMPGMTMVFRVKDPKLLDAAKEGQEIRFTILREGGAFWLQSVEPK